MIRRFTPLFPPLVRGDVMIFITRLCKQYFMLPLNKGGRLNMNIHRRIQTLTLSLNKGEEEGVLSSKRLSLLINADPNSPPSFPPW